MEKRKPAWAMRIVQSMRCLHLTQASLAKLLRVTPGTVFRWTRGTTRPTSENFLKLANLAGSHDSLYFQEQAGLTRARLLALVELSNSQTSMSIKLHEMRFVSPGSPADLVAIPILDAVAH